MSDIEIVVLEDTLGDSSQLKPEKTLHNVSTVNCTKNSATSVQESNPDLADVVTKPELDVSHMKNGATESKKPLVQQVKQNDSSDDNEEVIDLGLTKISKRRSKITDDEIRNLIVKCSACGKQVNHHYKERIRKHLHLGVLICKECFQFYSEGEFSEDDTGYKYCRWCAQGGKLYGCDFCPNTFCFECVRRNFGRGEVRRIQDEDKWKCYLCESSAMKEKVAFCDMIMDYAQRQNDKKAKLKTKGSRQTAAALITSDSENDVIDTVPAKWLPFNIERVILLSTKFHEKMLKLKHHHLKNKRSTKQIVSKFSELIDAYSTDINGVQKIVHNKYNHYVLHKRKSKSVKKNPVQKKNEDYCDEIINISDDGVKSKETSQDVIVNGVDVDELADKQVTEKDSADELESDLAVLAENSISNSEVLDNKDVPMPSHDTVNGVTEGEVTKEASDAGSCIDESLELSSVLNTGEPDMCESTVEKTVNNVSEKENSVDDEQLPVGDVENEADLLLADDTQKHSESDHKNTPSVNNNEEVVRESPEQVSKDKSPSEQCVDPSTLDDSDNSPVQSQSLLSDCLPVQNECNSGDPPHNVAVVKQLQNAIDDVLEKNEAAKQTLLSQMFDSDSDNDKAGLPKTSYRKSPKNKAPLQKGKKYKGVTPKNLSAKFGTEPDVAKRTKTQPKTVMQKQSRSKTSESSLSSSSSSSDSEVIIQNKKAKLKSTKISVENICGKEDSSSKLGSSLEAMLRHYADHFGDPKLLLHSGVCLEKLMLPPETDSDVPKSPKTEVPKNEGKNEIPENASGSKKEDDFDETFRKLSNLPKRKKKASSSESDDKGSTTKKTSQRKTKKPRIEEEENSCSEPFSLSSSSGDEELKKFRAEKKVDKSSFMLDRNELAKASLLDMNSASGSSSDSEVQISPKKVVKTKSGPEKSAPEESKSDSSSASSVSVNEINDSEEDFQLPKKKAKYDKLLKTPFLEQNSDSAQKDKPAKKAKDKKRTKRKIISSDEDGADKDKKKKDSNSSDSSSSSESEDDFKMKRGKKNQDTKAKKRKRIKELANSSNSDAGNKSDVEVLEGSQEASGGNKGRRNIRKIISEEKLTEETKEAEIAEKKRRKRVSERQKLYNQITEVIGDHGEMITKKMVLEVDQDSKEEVVQIHPDIVEKLKPHQVNGVKFMWECTIESLKQLKSSPGSGCILAHCMGLGKTLQVIAFLYTVFTNKFTKEHLRTALVICPYNTVLNWAKEFEIWLQDAEDSINIYEMAGAKDNYARKDVLKFWQDEGGVLIIGYDIFRRLVEGKMARAPKKMKESVFKLLVDPGPDIVICDEGHVLKNETSAVSKATNKLKTLRRIVLTGTPLQNNLKEYHCMVHFVKPNLLGTSKEFRNRFVNPIINGQCADSRDHDVKKMKKRVHILHKLLQGCVQRCDYSALTKFLPDKHEFVISVKLSDVQIKMYSYFLETLAHGKSDDGKVEGRKLFKDYNSLKNVWTHPYIVQKSYIRHRDAKMFCDTDSEGSLVDFIDDGSTSSKSDEVDDDDDDIKLLEDSVPSTSRGKEDSSGDEIIHKWKTRSRGSKRGQDISDEEVTEPLPEQKQWYNQFFSEEDNYKLELSGKMVLVFEILKECELIGDKVLLFSTSILTLDMIEELLSAEDEKFQVAASEQNVKCQDYIGSWIIGLDYFRLDGSTNVENRKRWIDIFNDKENERARLFLISTKAGGLGTNLVGANRVIMLDASWNPSHDVQAIFRVFRFGQVKPVYIYRLLAQGTMEEKIYDRQVTKLSLQCRVIDEQNVERHFNASELAELYKFDPEGQTARPTPMIPKDRLLADLLIKHKEWIVTYHEHDSLLQTEREDDLTEEERQAAWQEYENEREGILNNNAGNMFNARPFSFDPNVNYELPSADKDVKRCVEYIKTQNPGAGPELLLNKGIVAVANLKRHYGEILNKIRNERIRISQAGPVPEKMDAYIGALVTAITKTDMYTNQLKQQFYHYTMAKNTQWRAQQAQQAQKQQQWNQQPQFASASNNYTYMGRPPTHTNFPSGTQNWQNNAKGYTTQGVRIVQLSSTTGSGPSGNSPAAATSSSASNGQSPIITEVIDNTSTFDQQPTAPRTRSKAPSTVTITELD